ncbi:MAG: MBL fold metallo-hydrolase [Clostridia bacterium]|nr:MBL fold metallo-hydrolase [Clostridia bacterium]MBP3390819.1 MBL fold metallo-hydrolase [Clostridia bacterium]
MKIRFLGQSGYIIKTEKTEIMIDPYLSDSVNRIAGRPRSLPIPINPQDISCEAVICTHNHLDHLDPDTVAQINDEQLFITTNEGKAELNRLGKDNVVSLNIGESTVVSDIEITAVFADHTVEAFGLIVKAENKTLYFSGDTLYNEKLFDISQYKPDITFICINGRLGNMNVKEALMTAKKIGAKINIPNHYDMFASNSENPYLFSENIDGGNLLEFNKEYEI